MDSLRYWVTEMHVDGFRFDLATALARLVPRRRPCSARSVDHPAGPGARQVKLIAEPWDIGAGGYQVGEFPPLWSEWNDKYRDSVRDFWRGAGVASSRPRLAAHRLGRPVRQRRAARRSPRSTSSPPTTASPCATSSPTTHKHNEANGEDNRDGTDNNRSWNCGVEGETDDPDINALRRRQMRNLLATLLLSHRACR